MNNNSLFDQDQSLPTLNLSNSYGIFPQESFKTPNLNYSPKFAPNEGLSYEALPTADQNQK